MKFMIYTEGSKYYYFLLSIITYSIMIVMSNILSSKLHHSIQILYDQLMIDHI